MAASVGDYTKRSRQGWHISSFNLNYYTRASVIQPMCEHWTKVILLSFYNTEDHADGAHVDSRRVFQGLLVIDAGKKYRKRLRWG